MNSCTQLNPIPIIGNSDSGTLIDTMEDISNTDRTPSKPWLKRPGAAAPKASPDVKRRRKNYQVRKLLAPKNPLMIINELLPGLTYKFVETNNGHQTTFIATIEHDGRSWSGMGLSKKQAQQDAAEVALKALFFNKLIEQLVKKEEGDTDMKDVSQAIDSPAENSSSFPEDDTPWGGLASYAMFKLVSLWQTPQCPPVLHTPFTPKVEQPVTPPKFNCTPTTQNIFAPVPIEELIAKLPPNASEIDPVMLLYQISPSSKFEELTRDVRNGAPVFTLMVDFNGNSYTGTALKKKMAKKLCAKSALKILGVEYPDE